MAKLSSNAYPLTLMKSVALILILALLLIFVGFTWALNYQSRKIDATINKQLIETQQQLIQHKLEDAVNRPQQIANLFLQYIQGQDNHINTDALIPEMVYLTGHAFNSMPAFKSLSWLAADGAYFSIARRNHSHQIYLERTLPDDNHRLLTYSGLSQQSNIVKSTPHFRVENLLSFRRGKQKNSPFWLRQALSDGMAMAWNLPVYDTQNKFSGTIVCATTPSNMTAFLHGVLPDKNYAILLVDEKNDIVAQTENSRLFPQARQLASVRPSSTPFYYGDGENALLVSIFSVEDHGHLLQWKAILIAPQHEVMAELTQQRTVLTIGNVLFILLLMLVLVLVISHFTGSLQKMVDKIRLGLIPWKKEDKRLFPEVALLDDALNHFSLMFPATFDLKQRKLEVDSETGFLTRSGLLNCDSLYCHRNLLAMVHVSNYSSVKNVLGNTIAREFINQFTTRIRKILPQGALCCRDREDLFIIVFDGIYQNKDVNWHSSLLSSLFRITALDMSDEVHIFTGHIGMQIETLSAENISECLMNVSLALQHAQLQRSGASELFTAAMRDEEVHNLRLHQALCDDLHSEGFQLVLQPIVPFTAGQPCREGECLIRWQSNVLGVVPPDKFIALAENTGMIVPLGKWIVEAACRELAIFISRGAPVDFKLHVNISAIQLQQPDFSHHLLESIQRNELMNRNICIEITESVLLHDTWRVVEILAYLRRLGVSVAIDDFGSGYSSLSYLHSLPFDCLKIDRGFVRNVLDDPKSEAVIASVLMLAQSFSVPLVAEGVETREMAQKLQEMGCDLAQGYYFARPGAFASFVVESGVFIVEPE